MLLLYNILVLYEKNYRKIKNKFWGVDDNNNNDELISSINELNSSNVNREQSIMFFLQNEN